MVAHHARVWNRTLGDKPKIPNTKQWINTCSNSNNKVFVILTILKYLMDIIAPQSKWTSRVIDLVDKFPNIPLKPMGFPDDWEDCPIWRGT